MKFDGTVKLERRGRKVRITFTLDSDEQTDGFAADLVRQFECGQIEIDLGEKVLLS